MFYQELKANFEEKANSEQAQQLAGYMRNQFKFYGLHTPERRKDLSRFFIARKEENRLESIKSILGRSISRDAIFCL